jgi:Flp pilus assembly secretin CpaC
MQRLCRVIASSAILIAGLAALAPAAAGSLLVEVDRASILRLDAPAAAIVLGNPAIADALVKNNRMIVVTGKSYGSTNLIVLDEEGSTVEEVTLHVRPAHDAVVTVQRGTDRVSFTCAPTCERTLVVGDTSELYDELNSQIQTRINLSQGQAGSR